MNPMPFARRFPWLPALVILAFSGALFLCNWLVWTPVQRYYLGTYFKCGLLGNDPALRTEVRWLYKTAPTGKQELALTATWFRHLRAATFASRCSFRRRRGRPTGPD